MNVQTVIDLAEVTKTYRLYTRPSHRLLEVLWPFGTPRHVDFNALNGISFTLKQGESLGIIGRNGSGKSTLLKIIAGILAPTSGAVAVHGRIGCLLELGGGFNGELTGLENARMQLLFNRMPLRNATLLDELVDFAELGDFIEKPVKTYSSGMFMRLAFACATAVSPSILIVDEALAVGDARFVHKCMSRMSRLLEEGATLLFVSHDLEAVRQLCGKALLLDHGRQIGFGPTREIAETYMGLLRMEAGQAEGAVVGSEPVSFSEEEDCLTRALHRFDGHIDLAEQRLYVNGLWTWHVNAALGISARITRSEGAKAAFRAAGNRLVLSFLRGGGFVLPDVRVDGKTLCLKTENDEPYFDPAKATPQIRTFTQTLPAGVHTVIITVPRGPVAWLGGSVANESQVLQVVEEPREQAPSRDSDWRASLPSAAVIYGDGKAIITHVELLDAFTLEPVHEILTGTSVRLRVRARRLAVLEDNVSIGFKVQNKLSVGIFGTSTREEHYALDASASGWLIEFLFSVPLKDGDYTIAAAIASVLGMKQIIHDYVDVALSIRVRAMPQRTIWGEFQNSTRITVSESH